MAAESIADFADAAPTLDRRTRVVLGCRRALSRHPLRRRRIARVLDVDDGIPWAKWFVGGTCNIASICIDDHTGEQLAVVWEGEDGATRSLTGAELRTLVDRIASGLAARGVQEGDAVGLFMSMTPETVAAMFAIAKLGAMFLPIFSGYGAEAVAVRLADADAVALITCDGFTRRGRVVADEGDRRRGRRPGRHRAHCRRGAPARPHRHADDARIATSRSRSSPRSVPIASTPGRSTANIRCSSRTRAARRAGPRAQCTCTAASR